MTVSTPPRGSATPTFDELCAECGRTFAMHLHGTACFNFVRGRPAPSSDSGATAETEPFTVDSAIAALDYYAGSPQSYARQRHAREWLRAEHVRYDAAERRAVAAEREVERLRGLLLETEADIYMRGDYQRAAKLRAGLAASPDLAAENAQLRAVGERDVEFLTRVERCAIEAEREVERLRKALEFYAEPDSYKMRSVVLGSGRHQIESPLVEQDKGVQARAALASAPRTGET